MIVTRFAPSPTGLLHLGHAYAALYRLAPRARSEAAGFLLRIEDIDEGRCREEFVAAIMEDSPGSASIGTATCGGSRAISTTIARRSTVSRQRA